MTKRHFERMAEIVAGIHNGLWTADCPCWANADSQSADYRQAVTVAEAFIMLASEANPRFDRTRFLNACGLLDHKPQRKGGKS